MAVAKRTLLIQILFINALSFLPFVESAHQFRHVHHPHRRAVQPTAPFATATASAEDSILGDVSGILEGLKALPQDISTFFQELLNDINQLSGVLSNLTNATSAVKASGNANSILELGSVTSTMTVEPFTMPIVANTSSTTRPTTTFRSTVHATHTLTVEAVSTSVPINMSMVVPSTSASSLPRSAANTSDVVHGSMNNIAVYFNMSQSPSTKDLRKLCDDSAINIIMLGFVEVDVITSGAWEIHGACPAEGCKALGNEARRCQSMGKKIFASILATTTNDGAAFYKPDLNSSSDEASDEGLSPFDIADQLAEYVFNEFGPGGSVWGNFSVDGFDIYPDISTTNSSLNRTNTLLMPPYAATFVSSLRQQFVPDPDDNFKGYYISAAPPCIRPDQTLGLAALRLADFVYVRFYDSPHCDSDTQSQNLRKTISSWNRDLVMNNTSTSRPPAPPQFLLGVPANASLLDGLHGILNPVSAPLQGGLMLWGSPEAIEMPYKNESSVAAYAKSQLYCFGPKHQLVRCD